MVHAPDMTGFTAVHTAVECGALDILKLLILPHKVSRVGGRAVGCPSRS